MKNLKIVLAAAILATLCMPLNAQMKTASGVTIVPRNMQSQTQPQVNRPATTTTPVQRHGAYPQSKNSAVVQEHARMMAQQKAALANNQQRPAPVKANPANVPTGASGPTKLPTKAVSATKPTEVSQPAAKKEVHYGPTPRTPVPGAGKQGVGAK
jgi:hypothetical protein